jgi:hypothetical protein
MNDEEYRAFLAFLFERYVRPRVPFIRDRYLHHMGEEWSYHLDQAERAAVVLRFVEDHCLTDDDIYQTFQSERLKRTLSEAHSSLRFSNEAVEKTGFLEACESQLGPILEGLQAHHLPGIDREVLREMGSQDPEQEIRCLVHAARLNLERFVSPRREVRMEQELEQIEKLVARANERFGQSETAKSEIPRRSRRWFKALGQIAQGTALSLANVALAIGVLKFPVSPETQTWGAVASVVTGIGTLLSGVGDFRNE